MTDDTRGLRRAALRLHDGDPACRRRPKRGSWSEFSPATWESHFRYDEQRVLEARALLRGNRAVPA